MKNILEKPKEQIKTLLNFMFSKEDANDMIALGFAYSIFASYLNICLHDHCSDQNFQLTLRLINILASTLGITGLIVKKISPNEDRPNLTDLFMNSLRSNI